MMIPAGEVHLEGDLVFPSNAKGVVIFVHGSGSSRHSSRNQAVARVFQESGMGTLLFDLLTREEDEEDALTRALRFDIGMLTQRLLAVTRWLGTQEVPMAGYFGASTGAAAALRAAAELDGEIRAVVSRGGRPDLAGEALPKVIAPTLFIVGGNDGPVIGLNERAFAYLQCEKDMRIIPGATHLFEEPGTLDQVAALSAQWFHRHFNTT
jgi:putative phosphoribosyl transferase